jgi:hypothetical protein
MEHGGVQPWRPDGLRVENTVSRVLLSFVPKANTYILRFQEYTRVHMLPSHVLSGNVPLGEGDSEGERRVQGLQNVRDDIHLVDTFHL